MRQIALALCFSVLSFDVTAQADSGSIKDEAAALDQLIAATRTKLSAQQRLRKLLDIYRDTEDLIVLEENPQTITQLTRKLVGVASEIRQLIDEQGLSDYFDRPFLQDLNLIADLGGRRRLARP